MLFYLPFMAPEMNFALVWHCLKKVFRRRKKESFNGSMDIGFRLTLLMHSSAIHYKRLIYTNPDAS